MTQEEKERILSAVKGKDASEVVCLKSLYESCMKAWEQQQRGEKVTACGMSDEDISSS